jgi:hypothetical protein
MVDGEELKVIRPHHKRYLRGGDFVSVVVVQRTKHVLQSLVGQEPLGHLAELTEHP